MKNLTPDDIDAVALALDGADAFWAAVAEAARPFGFTTGDLAPGPSETFLDACIAVVKTWLAANAPAPAPEPCAAESNGMPRCDDDHKARGVACGVCAPSDEPCTACTGTGTDDSLDEVYTGNCLECQGTGDAP